MLNIDDQKTAARDRVRLLDGDVPPDLIYPYATLRETAIVDLGVNPAEVDAWLATWMTDYVPALGGVPSIVVRRDGAAGVDLVRTILLRIATGAYS